MSCFVAADVDRFTSSGQSLDLPGEESWATDHKDSSDGQVAFASFLDPDNLGIMASFMCLVTLAVFTISQIQGHSFSNLQPDVNPVPNLPGSFSKSPDHWMHTTPLLQNPRIPALPPPIPRRTLRHSNSSWNGWGDISYLFSL